MNPLQFLKEYHFADYWPPFAIYEGLLKLAVDKLHISETEARHRYWDASVKEWCEVLQVTTD